MLDFPGPSELHSLFQIFHKYKATLPEIKPPLEENSSKSSNIFINLTSKADLAKLKGTIKTAGYYPTYIDINRQKVQKIKVFSAFMSSSNILENCYKENCAYFSYLFVFNYQENLSSIVGSS